LKLEVKGKAAVEKDWPNHLYEPEALNNWSGNIGIAAGGDLVLIDADEDPLASWLEQHLPATFKVLSPGHRTPHYYLKVKDGNAENLVLYWREEKGERKVVGHLQAHNKYLVGPESVHPNGGVYQILSDAPIAEVSWSWLKKVLNPFLKERIERVEETAKQTLRESGLDIDILRVVPLAGLKRRGDEYQGPHPVHGSTTGKPPRECTNFCVNPRKNVWHCFAHDSGGGPFEYLAVGEGLIRCEDAGPGALKGEVFKKVLEKARERGLIKDEPVKPKPEPVVLSHLNMIEDPDLAGKPVVVEAVVSSTSVSYLAPSEVEATREDKDGFEQVVKKQVIPDDPLNIQLVGVNEAIKYRRLKRFLGLTKDANVKEKTFRTIYRIRVRPPVFTLEKHEEKVVDERGFEYKAFDIYVTSDQPIKFQPSCLIRVEGIPVPNPKTQQTTLLAYKIEFPEEAYFFNIESVKVLKSFFEGLTVRQRLEWILDNFERFSQIIGRRNLAKAGFLAYFTPTRIRLNSTIPQKGWANVLFCGDTTTAKTETMRRLIRLLKAGMLITAETASAVGLTGTATQVEREGWFVDWGFLVLMDRKLLAVDGAHKLSLSNWAALAEAERSGVVSIAKAAKNTAYGRTRQIKIANPVNREADKYSTKSLGGFLYACQALPTILDKTSIARLDLAVFSNQNDVSAEEINKFRNEEHGPFLENLAEVLKWCWSGKADVVFTDEAVDAIHRNATALYNEFFYEEIPLVSIDMKWKLWLGLSVRSIARLV
jgi:hypothetical protein